MRRGPILGPVSVMDTDTESQLSYASGPKSIKPTVKVAWRGGKKVDEENFLHMQEEYYRLKQAEKANEETMRQLTAQLARTEEAAKRTMVARDPSAKGGAAQRLLDLECEVSRVQADRTELEAKYVKERKRAGDFKTKSEELKRRLDTVLRDQRQLVQRVGNAEARRPRTSSLQSPLKSTDEHLSTAHRQLAEQQQELDRLRQETYMLKEAHQATGQHGQPYGQTAELQNMLSAYREQLSTSQQHIQILDLELNVLKQQQADTTKRVASQSAQLTLETVQSGGQTVFIDKLTGQAYTRGKNSAVLRHQGRWSEHTGFQPNQQEAVLSRGLAQLQNVASSQRQHLKQLFDTFDTDHLGSVPACHMPALLAKLLPTATTDDLQLIQSQLAIADKERLTFAELLTAFEEAVHASEAIASAAAAIPQEFQQLCISVKQCKKELGDLFGVYDTRALGTLDMRQVAQLLRRILHHVTDLQLRQLVAKLHCQGVRSPATLQDLFDAFQMGIAPKLHSGMHVRSSVNISPAAAVKAPPAELQTLRHQLAQLKQTAQLQTHACNSKDAELHSLRHALGQLRQELHKAEKHRLATPVPHAAQHSTGALEGQIRAAWDKANVLKTRFVETRNAFEQLKAQHARVVQELGDKVQNLHEQRLKQLNLERECSRLRQDLDRLAILQPLLDAERSDRQRLEKENTSLMGKTFAAPSTALVELQGLKTEVYSLRRGKANAELREAEARRELADQTSKEASNPGLPAEIMQMHQELTSAHKLVAHLKIELDAARSQLEIFRNVVPLQNSLQFSHIQQHAGPQFGSAGADTDLHRQLDDLQSKYQAERLEGDKIRQLLVYEETRRCDLEGSLDQAQKHARDQQRSLHNQVAQLQQECSALELLVNKLEAQLRRETGRKTASPLQQSQPAVAHSIDLVGMQGLSADETVIELHVERAELQCATGADFASFVELDFFQHATQATPVMQGPRPQYDTTVQFVVEMERFLAEHDGSSCLVLRLQQSTGYVYKPLGEACMSLQDLLHDLQAGGSVSQQSPSQTAQVLGIHGEVLGAITYSVSKHCPVAATQQAVQYTQPQPQAQPESLQHDISLPVAIHEDNCSDSSCSAAPIRRPSAGGQSQPASHAAAAADALSDAAASQDSTALSAFSTHRRTTSKQDVSVPAAHGQQGTEALSSSLDDDGDADSLIPLSSDDGEEASFAAPEASQTAQEAGHALHCPVSTVGGDSATSAPASEQHQSSSRRTTTDSVLDRMLQEVGSSAVSRQPSAVQTAAQPSDAGRRNTADTMLHAVPNQGNKTSEAQLAASTPMQGSNSRRNSASEGTASVNPFPRHADQAQAPAGRRSTAESVLASVLDEVENEVNDGGEGDADQASVDSLLDGVLAEVAGAASRQRTTADSVLDAMLDDMTTGQMRVHEADMRRQSSGQYSIQAGHLQQQQLQAEEDGEDSNSMLSGSPRAMLPSAAQPLSCKGCARYDMSDSGDGLQDALAFQVCCPLASADSQDWPDLSSHIVIAIESLELVQSYQQDAASQSIFVMYNFLPQFCQSAQDQCTQALSKGPGIMQYNHVVAYGVGFDSSQRLAARQELTNQLQCPDEAVIPVCLVCEKPGDDAAEKDYDQFGSGEVSLQGILELEQDLCHHKLAMSDAQQHHVGYLTISVRALQALRTMQARIH